MSKNNGQSKATTEQEAPYSYEAEQATIGAVLCYPEAYVYVAAFLKAEDFFFLRHNYIWQALGRLDQRNEPVDNLTLATELKAMGKLQDVGGEPYISELVINTPTSIYVETYAHYVERFAIRRRLMAASDEIKALASDAELATEAIVDQAEQKLFNVTGRKSTAEFSKMRDMVAEHTNRVETLMNEPRALVGFPSGYPLLDYVTRGYQRRRLYILAARPGMGKSALLACTALHMAKQGLRVAFFSFEMGNGEIMDRFAAIEAQLDANKFNTGEITQAEYQRYNVATSRLYDLPLYATDNGETTPMGIRSACRRLQHEQGLDAVFVDYIQLINPGSGKQFGTREQEVAYVSRSLKMLSKEINVPVLAAAQLSRAIEGRQDKKPVLSDLRESGGLEADADCVIFLSQKDNQPNVTEKDFWLMNADVAKNRGGRTGSLPLGFRREFTQYVSVAKE